MIYLSSTCFSSSPDHLLGVDPLGFTNIELSGNLPYNSSLQRNLAYLQNKQNYHFLLHNYVPLFPQPIVVNLGSLKETVYRSSIGYILQAILVTKELMMDTYSFHAGYYCNMSMKDFGNKIHDTKLYDRALSTERFIRAYKLIQKKSQGTNCYIENNVLTKENYARFNNQTPFMLLTYEDYVRLKKRISFHLLLDIGHLKVTCQTLGLDFPSELRRLISESDYLHISDNDGLQDSNEVVYEESELWRLLRLMPLKKKIITLEIKGNSDQIKKCYRLFSSLYE